MNAEEIYRLKADLMEFAGFCKKHGGTTWCSIPESAIDDYLSEKTKILVNPSHLVRFIDPEKEYPVSYTITQGGIKAYKRQMLKGSDLTQPQIVELFTNNALW